MKLVIYPERVYVRQKCNIWDEMGLFRQHFIYCCLLVFLLVLFFV